MPQIQNCVTRYSSPYWCSVPNIRKLACVVPKKNVTEIILWANLPMSTIFKVAENRKWTCRRFKNVLQYTVLHTDALCQISGSWPVWFQRKMWQKFFVTPTPTTQDDARRQKWSLYVTSAKAGSRHKKTTILYTLLLHNTQGWRLCDLLTICPLSLKKVQPLSPIINFQYSFIFQYEGL